MLHELYIIEKEHERRVRLACPRQEKERQLRLTWAKVLRNAARELQIRVVLGR